MTALFQYHGRAYPTRFYARNCDEFVMKLVTLGFFGGKNNYMREMTPTHNALHTQGQSIQFIQTRGATLAKIHTKSYRQLHIQFT